MYIVTVSSLILECSRLVARPVVPVRTYFGDRCTAYRLIVRIASGAHLLLAALHAGMVFERWIERGRRAGGSKEVVDAEDCFQCKLSGSVVFAGVSGYLLNERRGLPVTNGSQRRFLLGFAAVFGTLSVGRWFASDIYDMCFRKDPPSAIPPVERKG